jgi:hypothetical protein
LGLPTQAGNFLNEPRQPGGGRIMDDGLFQLAIPVAAGGTLVTLEVVADSLVFVENKSPGKILEALVCTDNEEICDTFESLTSRGWLHARVQNLGTLTATFYMEVRGCREGCWGMLLLLAPCWGMMLSPPDISVGKGSGIKLGDRWTPGDLMTWRPGAWCLVRLTAAY